MGSFRQEGQQTSETATEQISTGPRVTRAASPSESVAPESGPVPSSGNDAELDSGTISSTHPSHIAASHRDRQNDRSTGVEMIDQSLRRCMGSNQTGTRCYIQVYDLSHFHRNSAGGEHNRDLLSNDNSVPICCRWIILQNLRCKKLVFGSGHFCEYHDEVALSSFDPERCRAETSSGARCRNRTRHEN
jgi:hypothetical protein